MKLLTLAVQLNHLLYDSNTEDQKKVVQYTQTAANRQMQLTNRQTGSRFAAK